MRKDQEPKTWQVCLLTGVLTLASALFILWCRIDDGHTKRHAARPVTENHVVVNLGTVTMGDYILFEDCTAEELEEPIRTWNLTVVLRDKTDETDFESPTWRTETDKTGEPRNTFHANVKRSDLHLASTDYDVMLYYDHNGKKACIDTGWDLTEGGLVR